MLHYLQNTIYYNNIYFLFFYLTFYLFEIKLYNLSYFIFIILSWSRNQCYRFNRLT
jgi:hypothetical protein